jgi:hypothetical protein
MRKVISYKLVVEDNDNSIDVKVNALLKEGYELHGTPFTKTFFEYKVVPTLTRVCQAMVKYVEDNNNLKNMQDAWNSKVKREERAKDEIDMQHYWESAASDLTSNK